jgi:hypothetical protein
VISGTNLRGLRVALIAALALGVAMPGPAQAQFSKSYKFLESVKKKEGRRSPTLWPNRARRSSTPAMSPRAKPRCIS